MTIAETITTAALLLLTILQTAWFVVYVTGPWRATNLGAVWLAKGGLLAVAWFLLFVDQIHNVPDGYFAALGLVLVAATGWWLAATIRARRGPLN